jgi:hypothetical protein
MYNGISEGSAPGNTTWRGAVKFRGKILMFPLYHNSVDEAQEMTLLSAQDVVEHFSATESDSALVLLGNSIEGADTEGVSTPVSEPSITKNFVKKYFENVVIEERELTDEEFSEVFRVR